MSSNKPVHDWRECVISSDLPPTTRHILLTLSLHMDVWGESCYPTIEQIVYETGLGRSTVINHLRKAADMGWLVKSEHGFGGQEWRNHEYSASKPEGCEAVSWKHSNAYQETRKLRVKKRPEKPLKGGPANGPRSKKVVQLTDEGGPANDKKVVQLLDPSIPLLSIPVSSPESDAPKGKEKTAYDRLNQVAEVFNENLPALVTAELPQPMNWKRINSIKSIERERPKFQNIKTWEWFFSGIAELDYLSGTGKRKFKGGLDYFLHPDNFASAFEEVQALSEESA